MIWLRSIAFNVLFYVNLALFVVLGAEFFLVPRKIAVRALRAGDVRFRVELTADQLTAGPVRQEESTTIYTNLPASRRKRPSVD